MRISLMRSMAALALAISMAACAPPTASAPPESTDPLMEKAKDAGSVRVIALLQTQSAQPLAAPALAALQTQAVASMQAAGVANATALSPRLPLLVADVTADQLAAMQKNPAVSIIVEDALAFTDLAQSGGVVRAPQAGLLGATGAGQAVAILDTGVDAAHPFFGGRVVAEACFSTTSAAQRATSACPNGAGEMIGAGAAKPCAATGCDHGTHVAGIAAGQDATSAGIAPKASIIAVQVFSVFDASVCGGFGRSGPCVASFASDQIRGLDFVLAQARTRPVAAANMSLGGGRSSTACDADVAKIVIDDLRAAGVATVIAAGNNGFTDSVSRPGCISSAVTVSATDNQDAVAGFSNRSSLTDLFAPGVSIRSSTPNAQFAVFSGTSMAAPHVAGAIAALRSLQPGATLDAIEAALTSTGVAISDPASGVSKTRFNLEAAAKALTAKPAEAAMASGDTSAQPEAVQGLAAIAALPGDRSIRVIAMLNAPAGDAAATSAAMAAAKAAGCTATPLRPGMVVLEGKASAVAAFARTPHVRSVQIDTLATPQ